MITDLTLSLAACLFVAISAQQQVFAKDTWTSAQARLLEQVAKSDAEEEMRQHFQTMLIQLKTIEEQQAHYLGQRTKRENQTGAGPTQSSSASKPKPSPSPTVTQTTQTFTPGDPSSYLQEVLREPAEGETQIQGTLLRIECDAKGIIFVVKSGTETLRLYTPTFDPLVIRSYNPTIQGDITCGARKPGETAVFCFVKKSDKRLKRDGTIKSIEFVPADFKLAPVEP